MKKKALFLLGLLLISSFSIFGSFLPQIQNPKVVPKANAQVPSAWTVTNNNVGTASESCVLSSGYVFCVGTNTSVYFAQYTAGVMGAWTKAPGADNYPLSLTGGATPSCMAFNGFMDCVGGGSASAASEWVGISSSGFAGAWSASGSTAYPQTITQGLDCAEDTNHYAYCVSGFKAGGVTNIVESSLLNSAGGFGAWTAQPHGFLGCSSGVAIISGFIYQVGGSFANCGTLTNTAAFATVSSGTVGAWTNMTNPFPKSAENNNCLNFNSELICLAGGFKNDYYLTSIGSASATWTNDTTNLYPVTMRSDGVASTDSCVTDGSLAITCVNIQNAGVQHVYYSPLLTFTETLVCKLKSTGGSSETITLSGAASPSPTTATCTTGAGTSNSITVNPSAALTITTAADTASNRYRGNSSWTSATSYTFTTGSSAESHTLYNYAQLPFNNPAGMSIQITYLGASNTTTGNTGWIDNKGSLKVSSSVSGTGTFIVGAKSWIYQESTQAIDLLTNSSISSLSWDGAGGILSWGISSATNASVYYPSTFTANSCSVSCTPSGQYVSFQSGAQTMSVSFANPGGSNGVGGGPGGTPPPPPPPPTTQTAATSSYSSTGNESLAQPPIDALGSCAVIPVTNVTTVQSATTVTYVSAGAAQTYTTRIHVDKDDDPLADRNKKDADDFQQVVTPGQNQNVTTTLTQFQTATITSASTSCSFSTTVSASTASNTPLPNPHPAIPPGSANSTNWSGYVIQSSGVTDVKGSFIVSNTQCDISPKDAAFWIGIDGYTSSTVEQTGIISTCYQGQLSNFAFSEFYPAPPTFSANFTMKAGDIIYAEVQIYANTATTILQDKTSGSYYSTSNPIAQGTLLNSAEWITEAPEVNGQVSNLAAFNVSKYGMDYTQVPFTSFVTINGSTRALSQFPSTALSLVKMSQGGGVIAYPTPPTNDSTSFVVNGPVITFNLFAYLPYLALLLFGVAVVVGSQKTRKKKKNNLTGQETSNRGMKR